ncbi:MAG: hypothetical protein LBC74_05065, partial [Planctomycetaceae bacterium]|nr:hypothetical protein [Planctomycetaceae bacterium]
MVSEEPKAVFLQVTEKVQCFFFLTKKYINATRNLHRKTAFNSSETTPIPPKEGNKKTSPSDG